jgi:DnaJ like chaperone protein
MSIWGKIVGGAAGFALGGPLGAIIGGLAGHAVDRYRTGQGAEAASETGDATKQVAFTIAVIALGAKMAKADGRVTRDEIQAFREVFHVPPEETRNVARVFNYARRDTAGFQAYAQQVANLFRDTPQVLEDLLYGLFHIARADGVLHPNEEEYLREVARIFGFDRAAFERILNYQLPADEADPYQILGVSRKIADDELKRVYRRLIRENHPDRLIAQGMPAEFVDLANEKLARINDAYDRIAKQRALV